jgi:pimeloyl-ACP methyl ester carboxylesterase
MDKGSDPVTSRVAAWQAEGADEIACSRRIFARRRDGEGPLLLFLHGFPSSSYDWRLLLAELGEPRSLSFDCLGFGLSEKPRGRDYSLFEQADIAEELVGAEAGPVIAIGHDMGTSVGTELLARDLDGDLGFELAGMLLFNGSIVAELASLTLGQKLLLSRAGPLAARLSSKRFFVQQFGGVFSEAHPLSDEEADDQWALLVAGGGRGLGHHQVAYYNERIANAKRWHGALAEWPGELHYAWGLEDPVATSRMLEAVREIRPQAPATELPGLGHYPQLEDPAQIAAAVERLVASATRT